MNAFLAKKNLKKNKAKKRELYKKLRILHKEIAKIDSLIDMGEKVSYVYKGVAIFDSHGYICTTEWQCGRGVPRTANIYQNANNPKYWGVTAYDHHDQWLGAGYSRKEAQAIANEWVACGFLPKEKDRKWGVDA